MLIQILAFSALASIGAVMSSALLLLAPQRWLRSIIPGLVALSVGTLLAAAFVSMLPTSFGLAPAHQIGITVLAGFVLFFVLEKWLLWRHCHAPDCTLHAHSGGLILVGDALHNLVDGIAIAAAFLSSEALGIATALAVIAHEIPQEAGDFGILLSNGYSRNRALLLNTLSASSTLLGALAGYYWLGQAQTLLPYVLAVSAASFIYIAGADLIPRLHQQEGGIHSGTQLLLMLAGMATIIVLQLGQMH